MNSLADQEVKAKIRRQLRLWESPNELLSIAKRIVIRHNCCITPEERAMDDKLVSLITKIEDSADWVDREYYKCPKCGEDTDGPCVCQ